MTSLSKWWPERSTFFPIKNCKWQKTCQLQSYFQDTWAQLSCGTPHDTPLSALPLLVKFHFDAQQLRGAQKSEAPAGIAVLNQGLLESQHFLLFSPSWSASSSVLALSFSVYLLGGRYSTAEMVALWEPNYYAGHPFHSTISDLISQFSSWE